MVSVCIDESVGTDDPVAQGGAMDIASLLEDMDAGGVGGGYVGIDLVQRGVLPAEGGECLYHGGAVALVPVFVRDDDAHSGTAVDRVVVVQFDTSYGAVVAVEGIECEFSGRKGVSVLCF